MRRPEYLSPTSIGLFTYSIDEFYMRYLSDFRAPRDPQTKPMSIGSAFDAFVKSDLYERLFGKGHNPQYDLQTLFEEQVEEHNRDWAWINGFYAYKVYKGSGALNDLVLELNKAIGKPRFEISLKGIISGEESVTTKAEDVVLLGKPDCFFFNSEGYPVILDWKVNGYCSKASPKAGYIGCKNESDNLGPHRDATLLRHKGMMINSSIFLEGVDESWATQLAVYSWLCGADIGEEFLACIDQLACDSHKGDEYPYIRIAQHRNRVSGGFQLQLWERIKYIWKIVQSDHIFRDMSALESAQKCLMLDRKANMLKEMYESDDPDDQLFMELSK